MSSGTGEKTEKPTEKRLQDARKKGQVARSQDLTSALLLIAAVAVVWLVGGYIGGILQSFVKEQIEFAANFKGPFTEETAYNALWHGVSSMFWSLTPLFIIVLVFAFLGNYLQVGSIFSFESITPKFEKMNPAEGFKQKFLKARPYIELGKTIFKMAITASIAGYVLWGSREDIVRLISKPPDIVEYYSLIENF